MLFCLNPLSFGAAVPVLVGLFALRWMLTPLAGARCSHHLALRACALLLSYGHRPPSFLHDVLSKSAELRCCGPLSFGAAVFASPLSFGAAVPVFVDVFALRWMLTPLAGARYSHHLCALSVRKLFVVRALGRVLSCMMYCLNPLSFGAAVR